MGMIKCKCGAELPDTLKFCGSCGSAVVASENVAAAQTPVSSNVSTDVMANAKDAALRYKKYLKPAIAVVVALVAIFAVMNLFKPAKYMQAKGSVYISGYTGTGETYVIPNGKSTVETLDGELSRRVLSMDGTKAAMIIDEGGYGYTLYHVTDKVVKVAEDVENFWLSADGKVIAYIVDEDDSVAELYRYAGGKSTSISKDFYAYGYGYCAISPNGSALAFTTYDDDDYMGVVWDGKIREISKDMKMIAVADKAKYLYFEKNDALYVQKGANEKAYDNRVKLGEDVYALHANKDLSQVVYSSNSKAYISRNGKEKQSLSGSFYGLLTPAKTATYQADGIMIYGISSFADTFYANSSDSVVYIDSKFEANSNVKNVYSASLGKDGKTITYLKGGSIYRVNGKAANAVPKELVKGDVEGFFMLENGSLVYTNYDDEVYYQKGSSKPFRVIADNDDTEAGGMFKNTLYYADEDGKLFASTGGKAKAVKLNGVKGEVYRINANAFYMEIVTDYDGDEYYYYSTDGKKFVLIYSR